MSSTPKKRIGILASGEGTNFEAIVLATNVSTFPGEVVVLISDKKEAPVLDRAKQKKIPALFIDPQKYDSRQAYDQMLTMTLKQYQIDLVALAGFMRVLSPLFLKSFPKRILNIHPSLLPKYRGLNAVEKALKAQEKKTGCTVHYVDEGIDTGPIILQETIPILKEDTVLTLHKRIHAIEHELYPKAIKKVLCDLK